MLRIVSSEESGH